MTKQKKILLNYLLKQYKQSLKQQRMDWEGYNNIAIKINRKIKSGTNNEDAWNQVMEDQNLYGKANDVVSDRFTISKILDGKFKIKYKDDFIRNNPK